MVEKYDHELEKLASQLRAIRPAQRRIIIRLMTTIIGETSFYGDNGPKAYEDVSFRTTMLKETVKHTISHIKSLKKAKIRVLIPFIVAITAYVIFDKLSYSGNEWADNYIMRNFARLFSGFLQFMGGVWPIVLVFFVGCVPVILLSGIRRS